MQYTGLSQDAVKRLHDSCSRELPETVNALVMQESEGLELNAIECIHDYLMLEPVETVISARLSNNQVYDVGWNRFMDAMLLEINRRLSDLRRQMKDTRQQDNLPLEMTDDKGGNDNG